MKKIKILLVDDEYLALRLLAKFVENVPDLQLVAQTKSPLEAMDILQRETIDLLFLDIQMPILTGLNLLKTLRHPPITIFTTAYAEHAVDAFNIDAVDYLLKPFSFERFLQAVNKAKNQLLKTPTPASTVLPTSDTSERFIVVKSDAKTLKVFYADILFIEGLKEYVKIVCEYEKIVILESLKNLENTLAEGSFLRVHKSYIVNTKKVKSIEGNRLEIAEYKIPVSREKKQEVVGIIFG